MLIPRFILGFLYLYLGTQHLFIPSIFQRTLELPANRGIIFRDLLRVILADETLFFIIRIGTGALEIIIGAALVVGILLRIWGIVSTLILALIVIALIPSWFMIILHGLPLLLSIPMIFINSNRFAPAEKYIPQSLRKWHAK
jgi:uncharacterized membrane protein YphA (DoxX/SURF4 family)